MGMKISLWRADDGENSVQSIESENFDTAADPNTCQTTIPDRFLKIISLYLLSSLDGLFDTGAGRIVLWVTHAYARKHMIVHCVYAPVSKSRLR